MPIGYTTNTWMKHVNAQENRQLAAMVLAHDPKMISQIYNYDLELVKPIIDKSITYLNRMNFLRAKDHDELFKIFKYAYGVNKAFRKQLFVAIARMLNKNVNSGWWNATIKGEFILENYSELLYDMFLYDPTYIYAIKPGILKIVLDAQHKTFAEYLNTIKNKDVVKLIEKNLNKFQEKYYYGENYSKYEKFKQNIVGYYWGTETIFCKTLEEKIDELTELSGELDEKFSSALLYLKLTL
jgi:hypothetical protein